jgi:hypothetical protein
MAAAYINHTSSTSPNQARTEVQKSQSNLQSILLITWPINHIPISIYMMMRMGGHDLKLKGLKRALRQQQARLYIIRRCVVMLITRSD